MKTILYRLRAVIYSAAIPVLPQLLIFKMSFRRKVFGAKRHFHDRQKSFPTTPVIRGPSTENFLKTTLQKYFLKLVTFSKKS